MQSTFEQRQLLVGRGLNLMDVVNMDSRRAQQLIDQTRHLATTPLRRHDRADDGDRYSWQPR